MSTAAPTSKRLAPPPPQGAHHHSRHECSGTHHHSRHKHSGAHHHSGHKCSGIHSSLQTILPEDKEALQNGHKQLTYTVTVRDSQGINRQYTVSFSGKNIPIHAHQGFNKHLCKLLVAAIAKIKSIHSAQIKIHPDGGAPEVSINNQRQDKTKHLQKPLKLIALRFAPQKRLTRKAKFHADASAIDGSCAGIGADAAEKLYLFNTQSSANVQRSLKGNTADRATTDLDTRTFLKAVGSIAALYSLLAFKAVFYLATFPFFLMGFAIAAGLGRGERTSDTGCGGGEQCGGHGVHFHADGLNASPPNNNGWNRFKHLHRMYLGWGYNWHSVEKAIDIQNQEIKTLIRSYFIARWNRDLGSKIQLTLYGLLALNTFFNPIPGSSVAGILIAVTIFVLLAAVSAARNFFGTAIMNAVQTGLVHSNVHTDNDLQSHAKILLKAESYKRFSKHMESSSTVDAKRKTFASISVTSGILTLINALRQMTGHWFFQGILSGLKLSALSFFPLFLIYVVATVATFWIHPNTKKRIRIHLKNAISATIMMMDDVVGVVGQPPRNAHHHHYDSPMVVTIQQQEPEKKTHPHHAHPSSFIPCPHHPHHSHPAT